MKKHNDLRRAIEFRTVETEKDEMVIEGRAIVYDDKIELFTFGTKTYYEVVERGALKNADISDVFLRYNHKDNCMVLARTRNSTLEIEEREDGAYIVATLANTSHGRDLYELIKRRDIDKMSFAFSESEEHFNKDTNTWHVRDIKKVYDVSAVDHPAYQNTTLYARRLSDLEERQANLEKLETRRRRIRIMNMNQKN